MFPESLVFSILQMMIIGFIGTIIAGIFLLPQDFESKVWILFFVFIGLFIIPFAVLIYALSEKIWYKASGADELL